MQTLEKKGRKILFFFVIIPYHYQMNYLLILFLDIKRQNGNLHRSRLT